MTSSIAGIYAAPGVSVYGAAKHGVSWGASDVNAWHSCANNVAQIVGLTRSLAYRLKKRGELITVNAICPAFVVTGLISPDLAKKVPKEYITPVGTIVRAIEGFIDDQSVTGEVAECSGEEIFYRPVTSFSNKGSEWVMTGGLKFLMQAGEEQAIRK
jgi:NAD(P)-dependent dehydrogenase (short-subunit alcohol dehydrogenase family)